jgi:hypothetical protein
MAYLKSVRLKRFLWVRALRAQGRIVSLYPQYGTNLRSLLARDNFSIPEPPVELTALNAGGGSDVRRST